MRKFLFAVAAVILAVLVAVFFAAIVSAEAVPASLDAPASSQ